MEGLILFADDHIFESGRLENQLFNKFNNDGTFSVLPIDNLNILQKTVSSISTYRALILDWNFNRKNDLEEMGVDLPDENPLDLLTSTKIYSLIYVYTESDLGTETKEKLEKAYPNKIYFEKKINDPEKLESEYAKIISGIKKFEDSHTHLKTPFLWSQAINKSVQNIFEELESADPNWIKEIYTTAKNDGAEPNSEVITVFQNLLNESIIQNNDLTQSIKDTAELPEITVANREDSLAKLYHRMYYTKVIADAPLMTGDIFTLDTNTSAILITPECDVEQKCKLELDLFLITKTSFDDYLKKSLSFTKGSNPTAKQGEKIEKLFNQEEMKIHILPSFPFEQNSYKSSALVEFQSCYVTMKVDKLKDEAGKFKGRFYKLNSPYIHQLRQRYLAYSGRIGVPAIPPSLRSFNLK